MEFEYEDGTVKYYAEDEEIIHAIAEKIAGSTDKVNAVEEAICEAIDLEIFDLDAAKDKQYDYLRDYFYEIAVN